MLKGDIIRGRYGDLCLWRIDRTFGEDSPYVYCVLISNHKFHRAGMEKQMARKKDYQIEYDPEKFARDHGFTLEWDVKEDFRAEWK